MKNTNIRLTKGARKELRPYTKSKKQVKEISTFKKD